MDVTNVVSAEVGQVWRDEDGLKWRIVAVKPEWIYVKRHGYPKSATVQTHPAWLMHWARES